MSDWQILLLAMLISAAVTAFGIGLHIAIEHRHD